jgi:hypothetical protein
LVDELGMALWPLLEISETEKKRRQSWEKTAGEFLRNPERTLQRDVVEKRKTPLLKREAGAQGEFTRRQLTLPDGCSKTTGKPRRDLLMRFV